MSFFLVLQKIEHNLERNHITTTITMPRTIILPYVGFCNENSCTALRLNYGLHTQCVNKKYKKTEYCKVCLKYVETSEDNAPPYGTIFDRMKVGILDYVDPRKKKTVPYYKVLHKMKITKEQALEEAKMRNIVIPDIHWGETIHTQERGRPKKEIIVCTETDLIEKAVQEQSGPPTKCDIFEFENKTYLKTERNELYDIDTELFIGKYDAQNKNIIMT
jgi:hypothetical protein